MEALAYDATDMLVNLIAGGNMVIREDLRGRHPPVFRIPRNNGMASFSEWKGRRKPLHILMVVDGEFISGRQ